MQTLIDVWRNIVGQYVDYFTINQSYTIQWHYGKLLEYGFVSLAAIIVIVLVFRLLFMFVGLWGHKH